jgi:Xaa-Pro aminopeptidase
MHRIRIRKLQESLRNKNLDGALLLYYKDVYYFTGTVQLSSLLITLDNAFLFVLKDRNRALQETDLQVIPVKSFREVLDYIKDLKIKKIGLEEDILPVQVFRRMTKTTDCESVNITPEILQIRAVKDEEEIENMRLAAKQSKKALEIVPEIVKEGMTELELSAALEYVMRISGHEGNLRMRDWNSNILNVFVLSSGSMIPGRLNTVVDGRGLSIPGGLGASRKKLRKGDVIWIDISGHYNGYVTDETRCYVLGRADESVYQAYEFIKEVYLQLKDELKDGNHSDEIYYGVVKLAEKRGYKKNFMGMPPNQVKFVGHGIGLELDEIPVISGYKAKLKENMTISVEPKLVFPDASGIGLESTFLVTKKGGKEITDTPIDLIEI